MSHKINLFRPQRTSPEKLESIFVAREHLLSEVTDRLEKWEPEKSRQHYLFIGPRGIGKTHLLRLISFRISKNEVLRNKWHPLTFPEEKYSITKISDLFLEALRILSEEFHSDDILETYDQLKYNDNDDRVIDLSLDAFRKYHKKSGKGIILMIENINRLLERQIKDKTQVHYFRKILIEEEWIIAICTSPTYLNAVTKEDEPFFEFFQVNLLAELTFSEQFEMLKKIAEIENNLDFQKSLVNFKSKLQAFYLFTGGNPRLTIMLYDLISYKNIFEVQTELDRLLDKITPFYQDRMKDIGEQEAKVIETMALMIEGCTPKELAQKTRMKAKSVRAILQRLGKAGYIRNEPRRNKKTFYIIPERLFRIWHQMNHSRSFKGKIQYIIEFFSSWYQTKQERDEVWSDIMIELKYEHPEIDSKIERKEELYEFMDYIVEISDGNEQYQREFDIIRKIHIPQGHDIVNGELNKLDSKYKDKNDYYNYKGTFLINETNDPKNALIAFQKASELKADDIISLCNQSVVYTMLQQKNNAYRINDKIIELLQENEKSVDGVESIDLLLNILKNDKRDYLVSIAAYLINLLDIRQIIIDKIIIIFNNSNEAWRQALCIKALSSSKNQKVINILIKTLNAENHFVRRSAATALGKIGSEMAVKPLIHALNDDANNVRGSVANALGKIGSEIAVEYLILKLKDKDKDVQFSAFNSLFLIGSKKSISQIDRIFVESSEFLRKMKKTKIIKGFTRTLLESTFRSGNLPNIQKAIVTAQTQCNLNEYFFYPYTVALEYLEKNKDPAIIERHNIEIREAVKLLTDLSHRPKSFGVF